MRKQNKGQIAVEMVLILTVLVFTTYFIKDKLIQQQKIFTSFILSPWEQIAGMMESGVWEKREVSRHYHPNQFKRMWHREPKR